MCMVLHSSSFASESDVASSRLMQVLHGTFQIAKVAAIVGLTALATDRLQKEYYARKVRSCALSALIPVAVIRHCCLYSIPDVTVLHSIQLKINNALTSCKLDLTVC